MPAKLEPGTYRNITGNEALALGLVAAAGRAGCRSFCGSYPITPACDILHELAPLKNFGVTTFQAEDEIAAVCAAIGAVFGGALGVTATSRPRLALKAEAIGLAVMIELPLVIIDVQRGGPSTGLPTKTEQADLLQAMFGRNGESPVPVIAPASPADCFDAAHRGRARSRSRHMTPVILLSDGYIANGAEPWKLPPITAAARSGSRVPHRRPRASTPYLRDDHTLARPWAIPGTPGLEHRIGGLEKEDVTGNVSYEPENHEHMVRLRAEKVARVAAEIAPPEVDGDPTASCWSSAGAAPTARSAAASTRRAQQGESFGGRTSAGSTRCRSNLGEMLSRFDNGARARAEPRTARRCCCARATSSDAHQLHQGAGPAVHPPSRSCDKIVEALRAVTHSGDTSNGH